MTFSGTMIIRRDGCRVCFAQLHEELIAFDNLPVAGTYVSPSDLGPDPVFPLTLLRCTNCGLVQLRESLAPSFYKQYSFMSGVADGYKNHLSAIAVHLGEHWQPGTRVLEVGCSDGTLLHMLSGFGFSVAGFEPATSPAKVALEKGLAVSNQFLNADSAKRSGLEPAKIVIIRHVLEHIDDFDAIFAGIDLLASRDAMLLIEVPDLNSTVKKSIFSNVYHIHPCYFDAETMSALLARHGWQPVGSTTVNTFGGSLLVWAQREGSDALNRTTLTFEDISCGAAGGSTRERLEKFVIDWKTAAHATREFFDRLRDRGANVAGYGAAERTTSLMGVTGLDRSHISVVFDRNPNLVGRALPGNRIPIMDPETIGDHDLEYLAIFAQSFQEEIVSQQKSFLDAGGKFISLRSNQPEIFA